MAVTKIWKITNNLGKVINYSETSTRDEIRLRIVI